MLPKLKPIPAPLMPPPQSIAAPAPVISHYERYHYRTYIAPTIIAFFRVTTSAGATYFYTTRILSHFEEEEDPTLHGAKMIFTLTNISANALVNLCTRVPAIFHKHFHKPTKAAPFEHTTPLTCRSGIATALYYVVNVSGFDCSFFAAINYNFYMVLLCELFGDKNDTSIMLLGMMAFFCNLWTYYVYNIEAMKKNAAAFSNRIVHNDWQLDRDHAKAFATCLFGFLSYPCMSYLSAKYALTKLNGIHRLDENDINKIAIFQMCFSMITHAFTLIPAAYESYHVNEISHIAVKGWAKQLERILYVAIALDSTMTGLSHYIAIPYATKNIFNKAHDTQQRLFSALSALSTGKMNADFNGFAGWNQCKINVIAKYFPNSVVAYERVPAQSVVQNRHTLFASSRRETTLSQIEMAEWVESPRTSPTASASRNSL